MKEYELRIENSFGSMIIATFKDKMDLYNYVVSFPSPKDSEYYIVEIETLTKRLSINYFIRTHALSSENRK